MAEQQKLPRDRRGQPSITNAKRVSPTVKFTSDRPLYDALRRMNKRVNVSEIIREWLHMHPEIKAEIRAASGPK
jgi:hypothetical protein